MFGLSWARSACKPRYKTFDCLDRGVSETCKPVLGNSRGQICRGNQRRQIRASVPSPPWCRRPSRMNLVTNKFFRQSPLLETCQGWGRWWGRWSGRQGWRRWLSTSRVFGRGRDWAGRFVPVLCLRRRGKIHFWQKTKKGQFYLNQKVLHKFLQKTKRIREWKGLNNICIVWLFCSLSLTEKMTILPKDLNQVKAWVSQRASDITSLRCKAEEADTKVKCPPNNFFAECVCWGFISGLKVWNYLSCYLSSPVSAYKTMSERKMKMKIMLIR